MKQTCKFYAPVKKKADTTTNIEVGDPLDLVLTDGSVTTVYVTEVSPDARTVSWDMNNISLDVAKTSSQNATTAASDDTTGNALANALQTSYNAAQVDVATLYRNQVSLGSPTSSQNSTTAASSDGTRLALANALKASLNQLITDIAELFASHPELGDPTSEAEDTADGSDDATTNTLLNALKATYNAAQVDIAEAFTKLDTGAFQPRSRDVRAVDGAHQADAATNDDIHDGVGDDTPPRVPAVT